MEPQQDLFSSLSLYLLHNLEFLRKQTDTSLGVPRLLIKRFNPPIHVEEEQSGTKSRQIPHVYKKIQALNISFEL